MSIHGTQGIVFISCYKGCFADNVHVSNFIRTTAIKQLWKNKAALTRTSQGSQGSQRIFKKYNYFSGFRK